ncbi:MAG: sodium:solute symporter family protein [Planctomycetaceae bacterium]
MTPLIIISVYLLSLIGLGVLSSRRSRGTGEDYMLASHSIGPFLLLMSLFGTTMTAFALVGSTGKSFQLGIGVYGMMASSSGIVHSLCFFLIGVPIWKLGRKYGYSTQIQFFRDRLESDKIGLLLFPILVGLIIPYLLIGVMGGGITINKVTAGAFETAFADSGHGVPVWLGSLAICVVVLIYVFLGGMRGTAWANAFQTLVFMTLGVVTFYVIAQELGNQDSFLGNLQSATEAVQAKHPEKLTREKLPQSLFLSFMLIPLSAGMFPHLFQHWLTARNANAFKVPVVVHPLFILIVWVPCVLVGVWATSASVDGKPIIPPGFDNPNAVLGIMVAKLSGPLLAGLLTAGILAAVMSSLDSQFLCIGTMFTEDIAIHYGGKDRFADPVLLARSFIVGIVAVTYLLSLGNPAGVFDLAIWCFSGFTSLIPVVIAAIYWKRFTKMGAYAGVLVSAVLWCYFFRDADYGANGKYAYMVLGEYPVLPVVVMFLGSSLCVVLVSLVSKPPSEETLARFFPAARSSSS